jgi:hypothetical protein
VIDLVAGRRRPVGGGEVRRVDLKYSASEAVRRSGVPFTISVIGARPRR